MKRLITILLIASTTCLSTPGMAQGLKILISVDMEGVGGVVTDQQLGPSGFEYARFREFMTLEALAAIDGAIRGGATEIVVADSHGNGQNLLIEQFPESIRIIRSWPRRFGMVAGIDESFDGVMLVGYHSSTHNLEGVRAHTFSSARLTRVSLNGQPMSEGTWAASVAGHFGVPVIMVSGDNIATHEVKEILGDVEEAVVKEAYGFHSAKTLTPVASQKVIAEASFNAVRRIDDFKPYKISKPVTLDVSFKNYRPSEALAYLSIVERPDSHSIRFVGKDMVEIADFFVFLLEYSSYIEP